MSTEPNVPDAQNDAPGVADEIIDEVLAESDAELDSASKQAKERYRDTRTHVLVALGPHCSHPHISAAADTVTAMVKPQLEAVYAAGLRTMAELDSTKDALSAAYRERAHLVALLAAEYPSHIGHNDPFAPDWAVVTVELPTGQGCWHISADDKDLFQHIPPTPHYARGWDGHTTDEKYRRIRELAADTYTRRVAGTEAFLAAVEQHEAEQPQDDGDVRAVRGLTQAASRMLGTWAEANDDMRRELWTTLHDRADDVFDRFRERYAALDAKAVAALEARDAKGSE